MSNPLVSFLLFLFLNVTFRSATAKPEERSTTPFTPKAYLLRHWDRQIPNSLPKPSFLLSKASPLTAVNSAFLTKLTDAHSLSSHLQFFCTSANLFCFSDTSPSLEKFDKNVNFKLYSNKNFTNYGSSRLGGVDSFANYTQNENVVSDSFRRYSHDSSSHDDKFQNYGDAGNVVDGSFNTYGSSALKGTSEFKNYDKNVNVPNLRFTSYDAVANGRKQRFTTYTDDTNAGNEQFTSYGKNGLDVANEFSSYGKSSNVMGSGFTAYGEHGDDAVDSFTSYADDGNNPRNNFVSYGDAGNLITDTFSSYRDQANVGDDSFQSYAKHSNLGKVNFVNYGKSFNEGSDVFKGYGKGSGGASSVGFKIYGVNNTFQDYEKTGVITFAKYTNATVKSSPLSGGNLVNKWVEPGKFFRESMLKEGNVVPMPDISDKMPKRSFLPRGISSKLPFSSSKLTEVKEIFHATDNSSMATLLKNAIEECEREPSKGETKMCVGSIEDMIDFAVSVLGHDLVVRSTENVVGSKKDVMIGSVKGINGGKVTKSVSCHQSLFPYLVYYCHSVPKVRVYEADILDVKSKQKINKGVAICHIDTTAWSPTHGAFVALGSSPGHIEVCHWIFENDMTWATAD